MAHPRSYIRLVAIGVLTLVPIAIFALALLMLVWSFGAEIKRAWIITGVLISGVASFVGIREAMRTFHHQGSIISFTIAFVAMFGGTAAAALALTLGLPPLVCNMGGGRVVADIRILKTELEEYRKRNGVYPATEQWSQALEVAFKDPYGGEYVYRSPGRRFPTGYDLFSTGPDRVADTTDDEWGK